MSGGTGVAERGRVFAELVTIGRIDRPRGRHGEVVVTPLSDRPDRFPNLKRAWVPRADGSGREVEVRSCWPHKGRFVLKLAGVDSIEEAERYRGLELRIGEEELAALPAGSYYHHQLRGLAAVDPSGAPLGEVRDLLDAGAAPVLVVDGPEGELLIPLAEPFLKAVELGAGRIVLVRPELVEVDAAD